jgi:hypothetical protein
MGRTTRCLIIIPAVLFALFAKPAKAEVLYGIETTYYQIDQIPPAQSTDTYPVCGSEIENNINRSYDGEPFEDCTYDYFMVHMEGFITIPEHDTIEFWLASDDGGEITIGDSTFGVWQDQGCSATLSGPLQLESGAIPFELFMYENGGGTCLMLAWKIDDNYWEMVPEWAFTTTSTNSTTTSTTTVPSTTVPATDLTTTTVQETTTTTSTSTTSTTSTTTIVPQTTTSVENSTSTSSVPQTTSTEAATTTTQPPPTLPPTPPQTFVPISVETSVPTTLPETTTSTTSTTVTATTTTSPPPSSTTTTTSTSSLPPTTTIAPESPQTTLPAVLSDLTPTQALSVALASETLTTLTASQAEQVFASIETSELSDTQVAEITEAVQSAPTEVREAFEEQVDVFKAGFDDYVPLGSNIPVSERRTLIAVTAGITLAAAGTRIRR